MAPPKDPDRGLRSGYHRPVPHPWHNGERFHQWQDIHGSPQPLQDPRADHLQPPYAPRSGEWRQPASGVDYYDGAYPSQGYSRPGYEDPYQRYHSPTMREEHAYGNYYYHGHSQRLQEEGVPRQGSPYIWHEDYGDQKYPNDHLRENQNSPFGMNSETQFQSTSWTPYNDSPASSSGQERPGELFSESQLTGARKNKPSWTSKSNLVQQHESGLSSSSYELSQYMADAPEQYDPTASAAWSQGQVGDVPAAAPKAPMKFYIPHVSVSFGPGGQLVCVCPNSPADGQTALVVLHSMEVILNDSEDQEEMRSFSGPLISFTSTLALNDPLQTLFQLMSGRIPQAATCCGDKQWGDWRPHLAVILSNQAGDPELHQRAIVTMGDTLAGKGLVAAAHFCYLMAHEPFGLYTVKTDHLALLGSSHSQEFLRFATTEAIQRTEVFEYCRMLGRPKAFIPSFQVYKLLYASRLADYGLASQALHYCEAIGAAVLSQGGSIPPVLLAELIKLAEKLKLSDPLALERRRGDRDLEPDWLQQLRRRQRELEVRRKEPDTSSQDLPGRQGHSEAPGHHSAPWPEQAGPPQPSPQPPFPPQWGPLPVGGGTGHMQAPVPLYSVPETHLPGPSGDSVCDSVAVTGAPGGRAWEETLQTQPTSGASAASQDTAQHPGGPQDISKPQVPLALRARNFSESSTILGQEDEESSDEADKKSSPNAAQREKPGDVKEGTKGSGFGWFSWFRSKPRSNVSPSGEEDSGDSTDSEEKPDPAIPDETFASLIKFSTASPMEESSLSSLFAICSLCSAASSLQAESRLIDLCIHKAKYTHNTKRSARCTLAIISVGRAKLDDLRAALCSGIPKLRGPAWVLRSFQHSLFTFSLQWPQHFVHQAFTNMVRLSKGWVVLDYKGYTQQGSQGPTVTYG
ncbi:Protein transport protein Sec16B [Sciurus carolinensis]|uniref:Protein transport protein Sec16B n=1 Tax=Sciurus carolinensis TaxID=30640 RepID=A0AA41NCR1_SCICA|nr:Protein transport protein Sec16B [Sciurus carolinensis]